MSRLPEKGGRQSKAFCDGVAAQVAGALRDTNPFLDISALEAIDGVQALAWQEGWQAQDTPIPWVTATAHDFGEVVTSGGALYSSRSPDTTVSGATAPHLVGAIGTIIVNDGGIEWQFQGVGSAIDLSCCGLLPPNLGDPAYTPTDVSPVL